MFPITRANVNANHQSKNTLKGKDVSRNQESSIELERLQDVLSTFEIPDVSSDDQSGIKGPGSHYRVYKTVEKLPPAAAFFYKTASNVVDCALPKLVLAVSNMERVLQERKKSDLEGGADLRISDNHLETELYSTDSSVEEELDSS